MAYFPFFIDIENKKGLIVGGGRIAAHKAEKVKPFGAKITIIAPDIMDKLKQDPAFYVRGASLCAGGYRGLCICHCGNR